MAGLKARSQLMYFDTEAHLKATMGAWAGSLAYAQDTMLYFKFDGTNWTQIPTPDADVLLAANSDTRVPTQKAIKTYVDNMSPLGTPASATRSLNTNFQPSTTRNTLGSYTIEIAASLTLLTGQSSTVFFEISANGSSGWIEVSRFTNGNAGTLTVGLNLVQTITGNIVGIIPKTYYARLRTSGTATVTYRSGQETPA